MTNAGIDTTIRPFEWLTSAASLDEIVWPLLLPKKQQQQQQQQQQQRQSSRLTTEETNGEEVDAILLFNSNATLERCNVNSNHVLEQKNQSSKGSTKRILHLGCGSSVWGEHLASHPMYGDLIEQVVNVDVDSETLHAMQQRWQQRCNDDNDHHDADDERQQRMQFCHVDLSKQPIPIPSARDDGIDDSGFDLILDKSTLDCTLCSQDATAGLLIEAYRLLKVATKTSTAVHHLGHDPIDCHFGDTNGNGDNEDPTTAPAGSGGVYIVVSFHPADLLRPLLEGMPGADWDVSHTVLRRQNEILPTTTSTTKNKTTATTTMTQLENPLVTTTITAVGAVAMHDDSNQYLAQPPLPAMDDGVACREMETISTNVVDPHYRKTVQVFLCRRRATIPNETIGPSSIVCTCQENASNMMKSLSPSSTIRSDYCWICWRRAVTDHIHAVNDQWFRQSNPMLTDARCHQLAWQFQQALADVTTTRTDGAPACDREGNVSPLLPLPDAYAVLFTDAEREHLEYEFFLEDWHAFLQDHPNLPSHGMSFKTAMDFLEEMQ